MLAIIPALVVTVSRSSIALLIAPFVVFVLALVPGTGADGAAAGQTAARCMVDQLEIKAGMSSAGAGSVLSEFAFVNKASTTCSLYGYPHLQLLDSSGDPIATHDRDALPGFDSVPTKLVTLATGQRAWFGVYYPDATGYANLKCPTAWQLRFTPPHSNGTVTLAGKGAQITPYGGIIEHLRCGDVMLTPVAVKAVIGA